MMRVHKYRAWSLEEKRMFNVVSIQFNVWIAVPVQTAEGEYELNIISWDKMILMQFTGFTDCNNREIYDGDVYHKPKSKLWPENTRLFVMWNDEDGLWGARRDRRDPKSGAWLRIIAQLGFEYLGNVHDNPELLAEEE